MEDRITEAEKLFGKQLWPRRIIHWIDKRLLDLVCRNGSLWTSHAVAGSTGDACSRARYVRMGVAGAPTVLEDVSFGLDGCWYCTAVVLTGDTGDFWFFSSNNVEIVIKVRGRARRQ